MDYRHDSGDGVIIPPKLKHYLHLLRPVAVILAVADIIIPLLMLMGIVKSTFFTNFLIASFIVLFPTLYLIGMAFDNYIDRTQ